MNFIFGSLLWLLPLAAVPIIIHLLQRQRYVQVKFAATDFLRRAIQRVRDLGFSKAQRSFATS